VRHRALTRALAVAAVALVAVAPMAAAHVTVNPGEAEKGGFARLTFRVPNERDATTTTVEVNLPEDAPFSSVRVKPKTGWTYTMEKRTLDEPIDNHGEMVTEVVSKITWTGGPIGTTEFEEFDVSVGRMPEEGDFLLFPSIQTYSSGEVVRWIDEPVEGGEEPEHPAPLLTLVDPPEEGEEAAAPAEDDGAAEGEQAASVTNAASQDDVDSANTLATIGLIVGGLGLLAAIFATVRSRETA
jgi:uncharacterized protein YcnI